MMLEQDLNQNKLLEKEKALKQKNRDNQLFLIDLNQEMAGAHTNSKINNSKSSREKRLVRKHDSKRRDKVYVPISQELLANYTFNDTEMEIEVFTIFRTQIKKWIRKLSKEPSTESFRNIVHSIKGSANTIGALRLGRATEEAEQITEIKNLYKKKSAIRKIKREVDFVLSYIDLYEYRHTVSSVFNSSQIINS